MNHAAINIKDHLNVPDTNASGGLRRSCLVCRIMGFAIALLSAGLLLYSGVMHMNISLFAAFLLFWALGGGLTLVILSISALRQTPPSKS
jgi:hypothetical protein